MKQLLQLLIKLLAFWLAVFFVGRCLFSIINFSFFDVSFIEFFQGFIQGWFIDVSTFAYATSIPMLFYFVAYIFQVKYLFKMGNIVAYALIILYCLTSVGDAVLYTEWQTKLNVQALSHFANPSEVFKTASFELTALFFLTSFGFIFISTICFRKFIKKDLPQQNFSLHKKISALLIGLFLYSASWLIMIRGGVKAIPIQISDAYFSNQPILNDLAVNPAWSLVSDFTFYLSNEQNKSYTQLDESIATIRFEEMNFTPQDSTLFFLKNSKPNIVFILLESWTAHCVTAFGGDNFAPFVDSLAHEGIYFSNAYPAGHVSDQGIPAILSGQPCVSRMSVINQTSKSTHLPSINESLKPLGYSSAFLFGGDLNYGNIRGYLFNKQWDIIKEERDLPSDIERGKLGIQDKQMAPIFLNEINKAKEPFVYSWFTLSSHMPYDYGEPFKQLAINNIENEYANSITYSDEALKHFFDEAKKQTWYNNTLFVICADHSHACHKEYKNHEPAYHQIPMLFFGEVIKPEFKNYNFTQPVSQISIAKTLLYQMNLKDEAKKYTWGKNLFNPIENHYAYFCSFSHGGIVSPKGSVSFALEGGATYIRIGDEKTTDSLAISAKAFQQNVYEDYIQR